MKSQISSNKKVYYDDVNLTKLFSIEVQQYGVENREMIQQINPFY